MSARISVLLIEDDLEDIELIRRAFARASSDLFELHHVDRLRDAMQAVKRNQYHVVLLDLGLPDGVGLNAIEHLMSLIPETPVIILTGLDDEEADLRGIELGAQEFIRKGELGPKQLVAKIRQAIKRMQVHSQRLGRGAGVADQQRLQPLAKVVRQASDDISASVQSLRQTGLSEPQAVIVDEVERSSQAILNALERLVPTQVDVSKPADEAAES